MKNTTTLILLLVFSISIISCNNRDCPGEHEISGIIINSLDLCPPESSQDQFMISDSSTYKDLYTDQSSGELNCELPAIDFSTTSLLGLLATGKCSVIYQRNVTRNEADKNYNFTVTVKDCGNCKSLGISYNWVTVPAIPEGWTVSYDVID